MRISVLAITVAAISTLSVATANARTYNVDETQSRFIACYDKQYIPAVVRVNTRGKLVRAANKSWDITGDRWNYMRNPGVYIQTRRVVEPDHYTLVSTSCGQ